jgi:hypothetical protein
MGSWVHNLTNPCEDRQALILIPVVHRTPCAKDWGKLET